VLPKKNPNISGNKGNLWIILYIIFLIIIIIGLIMLYKYAHLLAVSPCEVCMNQTGATCFKVDIPR